MSSNPQRGDSDNNLLFKIAQSLYNSVSGSISTFISGQVADNAVETQNPIPVAGKAVTSASYAPAYTAGDRATVAVDKDTGGVLAHTRKLTVVDDAVVAAGDIAHDAVDSGSPIKFGGKAISTGEPGAVADNDRVNATFDTFGRLFVLVGGFNFVSLFTSAARTGTQTGSTQSNRSAKGLSIFFNVTAVSGAASVVLTVEIQDPVSLNWMAILTSAAIVTTGQRRFVIYPGITPVTNFAVSDVIPRSWRVVVTHGTADSITYSVGAIYQP